MKCTHQRNYAGIPLGLAVRRSIAKERTFRIRPGNGFYNAQLGQVYQDQYTYFIPTSINNVEGQNARDAFAQAIINWQAFSEAAKEIYNEKVQKAHLHMSGYNLYIREYVRVNA